jgi:tetratricopeptide (TPR) repeat protein
MEAITRQLMLCFVSALFLINCLNAQISPQKLGAEERDQVINRINELISANYVFADVGQQCGIYLKKRLDAGVYDDITHPRELVKRLNADMRSIHKDRHVRVQFITPDQERLQEQNPLLAFLLKTREKSLDNFGFKEIKIFTGNIGYIRIDAFEAVELARLHAISTMKYVENVDALIIDLRQNNGGNPAMVQFISSYFFQEATHLNSCYWRRGDYIEEFWTLDNVEGRKRPHLPLFVLVSTRTFSAAEEFAYNLKTQKRATIIGQRTAGGANPGYTFRINDRFSIFIPTGHAINPITNANWEWIGIEPDIKVIEKEALKIALEKAQRAAKIYRDAENEKTVDLYMKLVNILNHSSHVFAKQHEDSVKTSIDSILTKLLQVGLLEEWTINSFAYRYMSQGDIAMAIALLKFNIKKYPFSANAYDSLGEAYIKNEDKEAAIQCYQKSLQLDPQNQNAIFTLKKLGVDIE